MDNFLAIQDSLIHQGKLHMHENEKEQVKEGLHSWDMGTEDMRIHVIGCNLKPRDNYYYIKMRWPMLMWI